MKEIKSRLKEWNASEFGHIDHSIATLKEKIHELDLISNKKQLSDTEIADRRTAQSDLWTWLKRKETFWAQNSRSKWLREGDKNPKYFHALASTRKRKYRMSSLSANGITVEDPASIQREAVSFFKKIFHEEFSHRPIFSGLNFKILTPTQVEGLTAPFSRAEIDEAVDSCNAQKAHGLDGFKFQFIKAAWEVIKNNIYDILDTFWSTSRLPKGANVALIALIAICDNPGGLKDFRPISMVAAFIK